MGIDKPSMQNNLKNSRIQLEDTLLYDLFDKSYKKQIKNITATFHKILLTNQSLYESNLMDLITFNAMTKTYLLLIF